MRILLIIENFNYKRNIFFKNINKKVYFWNVKLSQVFDSIKWISLKISNHVAW